MNDPIIEDMWFAEIAKLVEESGWPSWFLNGKVIGKASEPDKPENEDDL